MSGGQPGLARLHVGGELCACYSPYDSRRSEVTRPPKSVVFVVLYGSNLRLLCVCVSDVNTIFENIKKIIKKNILFVVPQVLWAGP